MPIPAFSGQPAVPPEVVIRKAWGVLPIPPGTGASIASCSSVVRSLPDARPVKGFASASCCEVRGLRRLIDSRVGAGVWIGVFCVFSCFVY